MARRLCSVLGFAAAFAALGGCATAPETDTVSKRSTADAAERGYRSDADTMTGSRLNRTVSTDRHMRGADNATFRQESKITTLGDAIGRKGN